MDYGFPALAFNFFCLIETLHEWIDCEKACTSLTLFFYIEFCCPALTGGCSWCSVHCALCAALLAVTNSWDAT